MPTLVPLHAPCHYPRSPWKSAHRRRTTFSSHSLPLVYARPYFAPAGARLSATVRRRNGAPVPKERRGTEIGAAEPFPGERFRLTPPKPISAKSTEVAIVRSSKLSGAWCWGNGDRWREFGSPFAPPHTVGGSRSRWEGHDSVPATRGSGDLRPEASDARVRSRLSSGHTHVLDEKSLK
jgi:hypothetical protein